MIRPSNFKILNKHAKIFLGTNTLAYFASLSVTEEKSFITLTPGVTIQRKIRHWKLPRTYLIKPFSPLKFRHGTLERLSKTIFYSVAYFYLRLEAL
jgi:hypothetical protein